MGSVPKVPPGCAPVADSDGDAWPDNLQAWKAHREANGPDILAYIYNPTTRLGEFFVYDAEDNSTFHIHKKNADAWANTYDADDEARVYILEQLTFQLVDDVLQCYINNDSANPLHLVNHMVDLQAYAYMRDGSILPALGPGDEWSELRSIEISMIGESSFGNRQMYRHLQAHFFPRNVLSIAEAAPSNPTFVGEAGGGPGGSPGGKPGMPPGQAKKEFK
jgi:type IV pilus assembly protein PilW